MLAKIGIVGSGAMGSGIAQVAAVAGHEVFIYDSFPNALEKSKQQLSTTLQKLQEKGKIEDANSIFNRFSFVTDLVDLAQCSLIIEAIVEEIGIKKDLFSKLEKIVDKTTILATNTSSLAVTAIAAACQHPERVVGIHFFNPAPIMELVEIIPAIQTSAATLKTAKNQIDAWRKKTVICKDTPGFIVNRIARPFYSEALRIFDEGIADCATIDAAMKANGFRMGPFELMDFIGHDVNFRVTESVFQSFYFDPRYRPSFSQKRLFEAGWYGKKSGRGFYDYSLDAQQPAPSADNVLLEKIFMRIIAMLINEAADAHYYGIATIEDIETAMTKGVNYPKGLFAWADEIGYANIAQTMNDLYVYYGEDRYRCSPFLKQKLA